MFFQFLLAFMRMQQYTSTTEYINVDNQVAWAPSNQIFAVQFKCITREKFMVFCPTTSNYSVNLVQ